MIPVFEMFQRTWLAQILKNMGRSSKAGIINTFKDRAEAINKLFKLNVVILIEDAYFYNLLTDLPPQQLVICRFVMLNVPGSKLGLDIDVCSI